MAEEKVCLKRMMVDGKPQYCGAPAWTEPGRSKSYYVYVPRPGLADLKVNLCQPHALADAEEKYKVMWSEVQALEQDPGLDISGCRVSFQRAGNVLAEKPSIGLLMAANARASAFVDAARLYLEDAQGLLAGYSGIGVEDLMNQERSVQELLAQAESLKFRLMNAPRGEKPYKEMHDLSFRVRDAGRAFYRMALTFPERQERLLQQQERRDAERELREKGAQEHAEQRRFIEATRARLASLLNLPSTSDVPTDVLGSEEAIKAPKRKVKKASQPPDPSDNGRSLEGEVLEVVDAQAQGTKA